MKYKLTQAEVIALFRHHAEKLDIAFRQGRAPRRIELGDHIDALTLLLARIPDEELGE